MDAELILMVVSAVGAVAAAAYLVRSRARGVEQESVELPQAADAAPAPPPEYVWVDKPDFEAMDIDEIGAWKRARKERGGQGWREEVQIANEVQDRKIVEWHRAEAVTQIARVAAATDRTPTEVARDWLTDDQPGRQVQARLFLGMPRLGRE